MSRANNKTLETSVDVMCVMRPKTVSYRSAPPSRQQPHDPPRHHFDIFIFTHRHTAERER